MPGTVATGRSAEAGAAAGGTCAYKATALPTKTAAAAATMTRRELTDIETTLKELMTDFTGAHERLERPESPAPCASRSAQRPIHPARHLICADHRPCQPRPLRARPRQSARGAPGWH